MSSAISPRSSRLRGRPRFRASWTRRHTSALGSPLGRGSSAFVGPSAREARSTRSTMPVLRLAIVRLAILGEVGHELVRDRREDLHGVEPAPTVALARAVAVGQRDRAEVDEEGGELAPELAARDHPIDEAVVEQELRALESG